MEYPNFSNMLPGSVLPLCREPDWKTCFTTSIMERLAICGSFAGFHLMDFRDG